MKAQAATTIVHQGLLARLPIHRAWPQVDSRVRPTRSALPLTRRIGLQELYGVSPRVQVSTGGAPRQVCVPQPVVSPHGIEPQNLVLHTSALPTKLRRQVAGLPIPLGRAPPINRAPRQEVVPRSPAFTGFIWSKSSLTDSSRSRCYKVLGLVPLTRSGHTWQPSGSGGNRTRVQRVSDVRLYPLTNPFRPKVDSCGSPRSRPSQTESTST